MKKYIITRLVGLVLVIAVLLWSIGSYGMLHSTYLGFYEEASMQVLQIEEILLENDEYAEQLQEELKADFLIRAKAAAYMIQYNQDVIYDIEQLEYIISLLQIDEIHLFTPEGEIYSGNVPEYYGFTVNSGEQMSFFTPLLTDYDLELAQDVTPNTAEGKDMQYVAVWSEDRQHIVQIGIEPLRLLAAMEATELPYIFHRLTHTEDTAFFAMDSMSGEIIISTNPEVNSLSYEDLGLDSLDEETIGNTHNITFAGKAGHALILNHSNGIYIGYFETHSSIYNQTLVNIFFLIAISLVVAGVIIALIYVMLDKVILRRLLEVEEGMELIARGNLEYKMNVTGLPEFEILSDNVNSMVKKVVESSMKFSTIFEHINMPMAMYECSKDTLVTTGKLSEILQMTEETLQKELNSPKAFLALINEIMSQPHSSESDVYIYDTKKSVHFLKIMRYQDNESDWGLIIDSTDDINEKSMIKKERDLDFLTGLYGKRAFFEQLDALTLTPQKAKNAAVVMFDLDNLKYVNDTWGHDTGDKFIRAVADILHQLKYEPKICSRLSGDELAMVIYEAKDYLEIEQQIELLKKAFSTAYIVTPTKEKHKVSASIGYALFPEQSDSFKACLTYADKAMYAAKSKQKGSVEKYSPNNNYEKDTLNV